MNKTSELTDFQNKFFWVFVFSALMCFSPLKTLAYFIPFIIVIFLLIFSSERLIIFAKMIKFIVILTAVFLIYFIISDSSDFSKQNYLLAIVTFSCFIPLFVLDYRKLGNQALLRKTLGFLLILFSVEGIVGIVQGVFGFMQNGIFSADNGDIVQGTIFPHLRPENTFSNPMFAISMILIFISLTARIFYFHERKNWLIIIGLLSIVLASVVHAIIFLGLAILISLFIVRPKLKDLGINSVKSKVASMGLIIIFIMATAYFIGDNFKNIPDFYNLIVSEKVPRSTIVTNVLVDIPHDTPSSRWLGLGPGQFSSRASLIGSGTFIGGYNDARSITFLEPRASSSVKQYLIPLIEAWAGVTWSSSTFQPYLSLLTIIAEVGFIGLGIFLYFVGKVVVSVKNTIEKEPEKKSLGFVFLTGFVFIFLLGFQENYYEVPQAIFIGVLTLQILYAIIKAPPQTNR